MFKDSDSEEEGILSKALAKFAEKTDKGIDYNSSFASVTNEQDNDSINLLNTSDQLSEVQSTLRRSPRIKRNVSISDDADFPTSRRRRSKRVIHPEAGVARPKQRKKQGRKSKVICIGSDDDEDGYARVEVGSRSEKKNLIPSITLESEEEDSSKSEYLNEVVNVKIEWMCEGGLIIPLGRTEPFLKIYKELSRTKGYDVNKIVLCKKDGKVVKTHETPLSIKLSIIDILEGSVSSKAIEIDAKNSDSDGESSNKDLLNFKVLVEGQKAPCFVKIEKNQTMHVLLTKLTRKLKCSVDKMRLWFDGELVKPQDTPLSMDLEGDECLELKFKKK